MHDIAQAQLMDVVLHHGIQLVMKVFTNSTSATGRGYFKMVISER